VRGAGQSALGDLFARFFAVQSGAITIDSINIRDLSLTKLRSSIAIVEQTPLSISRYVRENITYANPSASEAQVLEVATQAGIHNFIASLPKGYETMIGESGSTLSVGEHQRIALARALHRKPDNLLVDEPTSALDPRTEAPVTNKLASVIRSTTIIVITHRRSLVETADHVVVLDQGRVVQQNYPDELLNAPRYSSHHFSAAANPQPQVSFV
jgi:ABC-type multidrug transport system fused ATPase/permease subunit